MNQIETVARAIHDADCDGVHYDADKYEPMAKAAIAAMPVQAEPVAGWVVGDADQDKWRTWGALGPEWTTDRDKATRYARRCDAEQVHAEDMDAWHVVPFSTPRPQEAVMQSELKPCPFCSEQCATLAINQGDKWAHYEPSCLEVRTGYDLSDDAAWRAEAIAAWNTRASDAEITRLTEALRAAEEREKALREALDCLPKHLTRTRGAKPC